MTKLRKIFIAIIAALTVAAVTRSARADGTAYKKGEISGTLRSAVHNFTAASGSVTLLTAPTGGSPTIYVVKQICRGGQLNAFLDTGSGAAVLDLYTGTGNDRCVSFDPGLVLPDGAALSCNASNPGQCVVTYIEAKRITP